MNKDKVVSVMKSAAVGLGCGVAVASLLIASLYFQGAMG